MASAAVSDQNEHPPHPSRVSDLKEHHHPPQLSLVVDTPPSASPFPSPSSSFLPPPIPGAHEFAMKPAPAGMRRSPRSRTQSEEDVVHPDEPRQSNGRQTRDAESPGPATPRPFLGSPASSNSPASATTPTAPTISPLARASAPAHDPPLPLTASPSTYTSMSTPFNTTNTTPSTSAAAPAPTSPASKRVSFPPPAQPPRTPTTPSFSASTPTTPSFSASFASSASSASSASGDAIPIPVPSSFRAAPPSPAMSRRASALVRSSSSASASSRGSASGSRRTSRVLAGARHRLSMSTSAATDEDERAQQEQEQDPEQAQLGELQTQTEHSSSTENATETAEEKDGEVERARRAPLIVRDFAFPPTDPRHAGLGPDVPPQCDPRRLLRKLNGSARLSDYSDAGQPEEEEDEDDNGWGGSAFLGRLRVGVGSAWAAAAAAASSPSSSGSGGVGAADFARNFGDADDDEEERVGGYEDDEEGEEGVGEEVLYYSEPGAPASGEDEDVPPGLYRAQFAFHALDAAEMPLREGQLIHVLGPGAAGWAVAREREPPLIVDGEGEGEEKGVLELGRMVGARRDAGRVWEEWWERAHGGAHAGAHVGERRALVPDSFLVMIRGEGEGEEEAHERLVRYLEWVERERLAQQQEEEEEALKREAEGGDAGADSPDSGSEEYEDAVEAAAA